MHVGTVPPGDGGSDSRDMHARRVITEELKFRLPAVAVRAPASMPGGSTLVSLAAVVSESGLQGSKLTAALMQAVHALEARPRIYEVQIFVDHCTDDGTVDPNGESCWSLGTPRRAQRADAGDPHPGTLPRSRGLWMA